MTGQVQVQTGDFDVGEQYRALLASGADSGGLALFIGRVRADEGADPVVALDLEHYPAMTERSLQALVGQAQERWALDQVSVVHRVGRLSVGDQIVFVGVAAAHRREAFAAAQFLMDKLKTTAPFWKKEFRRSGASAWVEAKASDEAAASYWA